MTVRTWVTLSVLVLVALSAAMAYQFLRPAQPPMIVLHSGATRVDGELEASCWPRRTGTVDCRRRSGVRPERRTVAAEGSFRLVFTYPGEPKTGYIRVTDEDGKTVLRENWSRSIDYDLDPGAYRVTAQAGAEGEAYVRYVFALMLTRSGS